MHGAGIGRRSSTDRGRVNPAPAARLSTRPESELEHHNALDGDARMSRDSFSPSANPLIGREAEVREIRALLTDPTCRLLTLVGPGGVGKTTLAMHLTADLQAVCS